MPILHLVLAVTLAQAAAPPAQSATAVQALKFAWPDNIAATVDTERSREQREGATTKKKSLVRTRYRLQVVPHAKGRLIRFTDHELLEPAVAGAPVQDVAQMLSSLSPSVVIDAEGTFKGVEDVETLRSVMEAMVAPLRKQATGTGLEAVLDGLTSEAFLASTAQQEWDAMVGNWVGAELSPKIVRFEGGTAIPIFPDVEVLMTGTMRMVEKVACQRAAVEVPCATFEMQTSIDPKSFEAVMARMLRGAKGLEGLKYERFDIQTVLRVTLETGTMLPHHFTMSKTVSMTASMPGQGSFDGVQIDKRTAKYTYPASR